MSNNNNKAIQEKLDKKIQLKETMKFKDNDDSRNKHRLHLQKLKSSITTGNYVEQPVSD